ncbi:MAG: class I SAM-dependent methyltransferase [Myxococcota bacterium]|nr:class I SAM-dependent methyltransferase [Myxococcota bacterium]
MANDEMHAYWNEGAGPVWVQRQEHLDRQLEDLDARTRARASIADGERVLDVGCGCGASTLELVRAVGGGGRVTGVDLSGPMLERARERAAAEGLESRVEWRQGDAQTLDLGAEGYDCVFSRFGVMFFEDPPAAFTNLARALRPGGRLAFVCWQGRERNPWMIAPAIAAAQHIEFPPPPPPEAPGPFAFADADRVTAILERGGFEDVSFESVEEPLTLGGGKVEHALELFLDIGPVGALLREKNPPPEQRTRVVDAVRTAIEAFRDGDTLRAPSAAWIVTASRP